MSFMPDQPKAAKNVPFYEDVSGKDGWVGQTSGKTVQRLKGEIADAIDRLGGSVSHFLSGNFEIGSKKRPGFQIKFTFFAGDGQPIASQMDIAALPCKREGNEDKSMRMALFMFRDAINGMWYMQQLSPGFAPLMPFMITKTGETVTQLWSKHTTMQALLPPPASAFNKDVIEGEIIS